MSMFSKSFKLEGVDDILSDIGYLEEKHGDGKCPDCGKEECECDDKKSSKKKDKPKRWWDDDGDGKGWEKGEVSGSFKKEEVDFSSVLDELTDEDVLFLTDDLIEEVVEEFFYETLEEGYEIEELETLLIERVDSELTYLEEAKVTLGHDTKQDAGNAAREKLMSKKPAEASRGSKLEKIKSAVKKVASGAKKVATKTAGAAGEVVGSAVAGYKKATAAAKDAPSATKSDSNDSKSDSPSTGTRSSGGGSSSSSSGAKGTKRPGLLGRIASGLKSGLKKAIHGTAKAVGKVVKTAKAGYDEGRGKTAPAAAKPAPKAAAKPAPKAAAKPAAKKKSGGNLDNLLKQIRSEEVEMTEAKQGPCWKGYEMIGMKKKGGREVPNCVPKEEYEELVMDMIDEGYDMDQVREVIAAYEDGFEVIFEEDGVTINETQELLDEETEFLADVEMVANWLHAEGIIVDEDQFFELMEDLSEEEIQDLYDVVVEATAMAKRGYDETEIRNKIAKSTGGGKSADRATALEKKPTYGNDKVAKQRSELARKQRGDFRKTTSSSPGLHGYAHKSNDPKVKAKQAARGAQRGALTPNEKKELNREGVEMIGDSLENGGLEVRNYSWREVMNMEGYQRNPEKGEKEDKKYAHVRGEKTPMPPRGDKRREDFEKWYAKNVR